MEARGSGNWMKGEGRKDMGVIRRYEERGGTREDERGWRRKKKVDESKGRK